MRAHIHIAPLGAAVLLGIVVGITVAHVGTPASAQSRAVGAADCDLELGRRVFGQCAICHSLEEGAASIAGPNLHGVVGRVAGSAPGFAYSKAMREFGKRWTTAELELFLAQPMAHVPGTSMAFAGLRNPKERAAVICYLQSTTGPAAAADR